MGILRKYDPGFSPVKTRQKREDERKGQLNLIFNGFIGMSAIIFSGLIISYFFQRTVTEVVSNYSPIFYLSGLILAGFLISLHFARHYAFDNELFKNRAYLVSSFLLGLAFLAFQYFVFSMTSGSGNLNFFILLISTIHGIYFGIGLLLVFSTWIASLKYKVHSRSMALIRNLTFYSWFTAITWVVMHSVFILFP